MKVRMFVEIELNSAAMVDALGEQYAMVVASGAVESRLGQIVGKAVQGVPHLKDVQVSILPVALHSDRLAG